MAQAAADNDTAEVRSLAHSLAGSSANFGAKIVAGSVGSTGFKPLIVSAELTGNIVLFTGEASSETGTVILNGLNSYTGKTTLSAGTIEAKQIGNNGTLGNLGTGDTIEFSTARSTLRYAGAGESNNRSLAILGALEPVISAEAFARGNKAVKEFLGYLEILVERRRAKPGNPERDVLTRLIQGEDSASRS